MLVIIPHGPITPQQQTNGEWSMVSPLEIKNFIIWSYLKFENLKKKALRIFVGD